MNENLIVELEKDGVVRPTFRRLSVDKKAKVYKAALEMFSNMVYDQVSLDILVNKAEISKGSLFQYFGNKSNILKFVIHICFDYYSDYWENYFANEQPVRAKDRLLQYFLRHFEYYLDSPAEYNFFIKMNYENSLQNSGIFIELMTNRQIQYISKILNRGAAVGEIRQDIEPDEISNLLQIILQGLLRSKKFDESESDRETNIKRKIENTISFIFDGLSN